MKNMKFRIFMVILLAGIFYLGTKYPPAAIAAGIAWFILLLKFWGKK